MVAKITKRQRKNGGSAGNPHKHIQFFKVIDAVTDDVCPVCALMDKAEKQFIHTLLLERVTDRSLRKRFNEDGGFCRNHTSKLLKRHDGLGMVLLNRSLLEREIQWLEGVGGPKNIPEPARGRCEICSYLDEHEKRRIETFVQFFNEKEMKEKILSSSGFCISHLRMLQKVMPKGLPEWFRQFQVRQYQCLQDNCNRYVESENYTLGSERPVLTREESLIWKRMVKVLYGLFK